MSRFARERSSSVATDAPVEAGDTEGRFQELKTRFDVLKERKMALRMQAEHTQRAVDECRQAAMREYGVDSLEALEALAEQQARAFRPLLPKGFIL